MRSEVTSQCSVRFRSRRVWSTELSEGQGDSRRFRLMLKQGNEWSEKQDKFLRRSAFGVIWIFVVSYWQPELNHLRIAWCFSGRHASQNLSLFWFFSWHFVASQRWIFTGRVSLSLSESGEMPLLGYICSICSEHTPFHTVLRVAQNAASSRSTCCFFMLYRKAEDRPRGAFCRVLSCQRGY